MLLKFPNIIVVVVVVVVETLFTGPKKATGTLFVYRQSMRLWSKLSGSFRRLCANKDLQQTGICEV